MYNDAYVARTTRNSTDFNFSNKFTGFTVSSYTNGTGTFNVNGTGSAANDGGSARLSLPAHIYHTRNKYTLTFGDYYSDGTDYVYPEQVYYEASLAQFASVKPPERDLQDFDGWYEDAACTKKFEFGNEAMPAANKKVYAKWIYKYYFVEIDPDGGEMENGTVFRDYFSFDESGGKSTYTWLQYGDKLQEYQNVERTYVPDNNGDYVYVNVKFAPSFDEAVVKDWDYCLPANYRAAFYCPKNELSTLYDEHFKDFSLNGEQLLTWENFQAYCVDKEHFYRKATGQEGYALVAWYVVDKDGNTTKLFSEEKDGLVNVDKQSPGVFTVTMKKATERDEKGNVVPTQIKLVLPEGEGARYSVTGSVADTKNADGSGVQSNYGTLNVYNSGGASDKIYYNNQWYNLNNQSTSNYAVSGSMKLGREGQTVAFYSQEPETVSVYLQAWYYDISNGWTDDRGNASGPNASLSFEDYEGIGGTTTSDGTGITGLEIIKNSSYSFSVNQSYANTGQYKFIGWYAEPEAAPDAVSLDGKSNVFGDSKVTDISVPNEKVTHYYALYVPYTDGTLTLNHEERKESIGYAKRIYISADYNSKTYTDEEITSITNVSEYVDKAKATVNILVIEPRTDADNSAPIAITLKAMAGYGCTYNTTYEGARQLTTGARDTSSATDVFYDPTETDSSQPHETKYYYVYTLQKTIGEMYTAGETVKGLRVLGNIDYYSDFKRKYEFVYNYVFRDGETPRKYVVTGETAQHSTQADFSRFVLEQAPYISNFGEDFAWNIASIQISNLNNKGKITASMDSVQSKKAMATVTVKSYNSAVEIKWQTEVGTAFPEGNRPVAEKVIDNKQFSHWEITNTDTGEFVGRCYYYAFTFAVWDNYTLEPVYIDLSEDGEYHRVYPTADKTYVTLDYLDSTRNQWVNLDENGGYDSDALVYNDSLINDFDVTFIDRSNQIKTDASNYHLGLLFEIVDTVEPGTNMNEYTLPVYTADDEALRDKAVNAIIAKSGASGTIKAQNKPKFYYSAINPLSLSSDNRAEYYRGVDNLLSGDSLNPNATYVFRVVAYMKTGDNIYYSNPVTPHSATETGGYGDGDFGGGDDIEL